MPQSPPTNPRTTRVYKKRFRDAPFKNGWKVFVNALGIFALAFAFVFAINRYSERSGSIVNLVTPPHGPLFQDQKKNGLRVMRLPIGAPLSYDLTWYYLEGGCDTHLTLEYQQMFDAPPRTTITLEIKGRLLAVGQPGPDHIERPQPPGITPGLWLYSSTLHGTCANGRKPPPEKLAEFYVEIYDPKKPVLEFTKPVDFSTPVISSGGQLKWNVSFDRKVAGKSTVIYTLVAKDAGRTRPGEQDIFVLQKPANFPNPGHYSDVDVAFQTPQGIRPGLWTLQVTIVTNLPSGRVQTDHLFDANFEVQS